MSVDVLAPSPASTKRTTARAVAAPRRAPARHGLRPPRTWTVERPRLLRGLVDGSRPLAVVVAPAGYGKTTMLAQWCARDSRPFAWVALTRHHDHPDLVVEAIGTALCSIQPLPAEAVTPGATLDDLLHAVGSLRPSVLVIDDLHAVDEATIAEIVEAVADHMPPGVTIALASRREPPLPLARRRAQDDVVEVRSAALAMSRDEALTLLRHLGLALDGRRTSRLLTQASGWPAALRLAARALADGGPDALDRLGAHPLLAGYVGEEVLAGLPAHDRAFLRDASALDPVTGPLCDAVLGPDGAARLHHLAASTGLLEPADHTTGALRAHPLLTQALQRELHEIDPRRERELHSLASAWHERHGDATSAVEHALEAEDAPRVGKLLGRLAPGVAGSGARDVLAGWLDRLAPDVVATEPGLAVAAALERCIGGDRDGAEHWAVNAADRLGACDDHETAEAGVHVVRAALARDGIEAAALDAARALMLAPEASAWRPYACLLEGALCAAAGRHDDAVARLDEGARAAVVSAPLVRSLCLSVHAFLALDAGDRDDAESLAAAGRAAADRDAAREPLAGLSYAVAALVMSSCGRLEAARRDAGEAAARLERLPDPPPWYRALAGVALARTALRLSEVQDARRILGEADRVARHVPDAAALRAWIDEAWALADDFAAGPVGATSALTLAELRVLRLLPSHLTFREIAARLHVSSNTIKTQAHAVYRKLDACSRSEAVAHATAIGLLDAEITRTG